MKDPVKNGIAKGSLLTKKEFETMLNAYFNARGWTELGIPTKQKLIELELDKMVTEII